MEGSSTSNFYALVEEIRKRANEDTDFRTGRCKNRYLWSCSTLATYTGMPLDDKKLVLDSYGSKPLEAYVSGNSTDKDKRNRYRSGYRRYHVALDTIELVASIILLVGDDDPVSACSFARALETLGSEYDLELSYLKVKGQQYTNSKMNLKITRNKLLKGRHCVECFAILRGGGGHVNEISRRPRCWFCTMKKFKLVTRTMARTIMMRVFKLPTEFVCNIMGLRRNSRSVVMNMRRGNKNDPMFVVQDRSEISGAGFPLVRRMKYMKQWYFSYEDLVRAGKVCRKGFIKEYGIEDDDDTEKKISLLDDPDQEKEFLVRIGKHVDKDFYLTGWGKME
jgi:hypothetical protein